MQRDFPSVLRMAGVWLIYCAWAIACGWLLSVFKQLTPLSYALCGPVFIVAAAWWWRVSSPGKAARRPFFGGIRRKAANPARVGWFVASLLILLAALIHSPANHDALTYRLPRLYYWLQDQGWFWIGGLDYRMDIAGTGFEWMSAPILLATGSDRLLFLLNYIPFLLLPDLSYLAGLGVGLRARESRWWMWVWPLSYGVAMQAGSIGNDFIAAALSLASLAFTREAGRRRPLICLSFSALAMVLMTGVKITTLPLVLPLAIYWLSQAWKHLTPAKILHIPLVLAPVILLCGMIPVSFLCWKHTGAWTGNPGNRLGIEVKNPAAGLIGNGMNLAAATLYPPVLPGAGTIGTRVTAWLDAQPWHDWIREGNSSYTINLNQELPSEELAGIGIAVTYLMGIWALRGFAKHGVATSRPGFSKIYLAATFVALLVFLAKVSSGTTARLAVPFIPHLVFSCLLLFRSPRTLPHGNWAVLPALFLLPTLILNPNRPLIPASLLKSLPFIPASISRRMDVVYSAYSQRNRLLSPLADLIPDGATVAFAGTTDHPASALFQPLNRIRVMDLNSSNFSRAEWIIGTKEAIDQRLAPSERKLLEENHTVAHSMLLTDKVVIGPETWLLYRRNSVSG